MSIKLITLKTNHTLLGNVTENEDTVSIKQAVQVVSVPPSQQNPEGGVGFAPFLEFSNEWKTGIEIELFDVLTINTPVVELENQYNSIFGSGIQIASASALPRV